MLLDVHLIKCVEEVEENIVLFFSIIIIIIISVLLFVFFLAIFCNPPEGGRGRRRWEEEVFFVMFFFLNFFFFNFKLFLLLGWMLLDVHSHAVDATPIDTLKAGHVDVSQTISLVLSCSSGRSSCCCRVGLLLLLLLGHGGCYGCVVALTGADGGASGTTSGRSRQRVRTVAVTGQRRITCD